AFLTEHLRHPVSVWIKVDCGYHRTGISYDDARQLNAVAEAVRNSGKMELLGLLTHGGDTYHAPDRAAVTARYQHSLERLLEAQRTLMLAGFSDLQLSVGDTPACSLVDSFGPVDEIRPGNFVFYDATQAMLGACQPDQISVALACPVVAKHAERSEVVIYGGAIHLSKDAHPYAAIPAAYGLAALQEDDSWGGALEGSYVRSLSQEHGVVRVNPYGFNRIQVGDLLFILPAHSCLTVQAMREMVTLEGTRITTMLSEERG
ncbi:MAG: alanine racemase, partial [Anaerolineaceae bacterium]|nr:alanine racemase [Anaerolineaceae bacterium]